MADVAIAPRFALNAPMTITSPTSEKPFARWALMALAFVFLGIFLLLPLVIVFAQAFGRGPAKVLETLADPDTLSAIWLTLMSVPDTTAHPTGFVDSRWKVSSRFRS